MRTLSIDPGYGRIGFAVAEKTGGTVTIIFSECFETEAGLPISEKLLLVGKRQESLIREHEPDCVSIEKLFFSKNKKTAMRTAEARGVCIYIAKKENKEVVEYAPSQIKSAVTGNGNAGKKEMIRMVRILTGIGAGEKKHDDEYDAIAIAITHLETPRELRETMAESAGA